MHLTEPNKANSAAGFSFANRVNFLSVLMIVTSSLMIVLNLYNATYQNAIGAGLYFLLVIILLLDYHFKANFVRWAWLFLLLTAITSLYLFYQRGTAGMGVFWSLIVPLLVFTVTTPKKGLQAMLVFVLAMFLLFFVKRHFAAGEQLPFSGFITLMSILITMVGFLYVLNKSRLSAEQMAWSKHKKLNELLNHLSQGLAMIDLDMRVTEVNDKLMEWFPNIKISDKPFCFTCLDLEAHAEICEDCQMKKALETGKTQERIKLKKTVTGIRLFKITATPVKNQSGDTIAFIESLEDITELRKMETLARENESRFRTLFEQLPGIAVQGYNREGRVLYWNKASEKMYGYTDAEAIGKRIDELIVPPDQVDYVYRSISEWFENATPENALELELKHKDGHKINTLTNNILLPNSRGELELFSMDIDLTERLKVEEALRLSDQIVNRALDMLCVAGFDGYFKTLNPAWSKVLGWSTEELLARPWNDFVHPDDLEATNAVKATLVNGEMAYQFINRYICKDGSIKWLSWNSFPIAEQGIMIGVARDITKLKEIEDQLRESEARLAGFVDDLPGFVYRCKNDENWTMEFMSSGCKAITGYEADDFIANNKLTYNDLICPEWQEEVRAKWEVAIQNKQFCELEYKICHANGSPRWFWERGHAMYNEQGAVEYLDGFIMDITERRNAEAALHESQQKLKDIFDGANIGISITDINGKFVMANDWWLNFLGYSQDEMLPLTNLEITFTDDRAESIAMKQKILHGEIDHYRLQKRYVTKDKSIVWGDLSVSTIQDEQGKPYLFAGMVIDITAQIRNQEALKKSEARYRLITENSTDVIWVMDIESRKFGYISPSIEQLRGYTVSEAMKQDLNESVAPESIPLVEEQLANGLKRFLQGESRPLEPFLTEIMQPCKDGRLIWVEVSTTFRRNQDGRLEVVGISRNIEERKRMEIELLNAKEKLELSNITKDKFFSIIAHDLRSPFSGLLGLSELLNDNLEILSDKEIRQSAKMINQAADNAYDLLENLLEWSRAQRGILAFDPQNLVLFKEVENQIKLSANHASQKQIALINDIDPLSIILADQHMLSSMLRNLISNGIKFSNPGNKIWIYNLKSTADSLQLIVEDQGVGMDNSKLKQLFSIASKGEKGTGNEPGSGLGLILVKDFVEKHGGEITVESEPGKGSKFILDFPISQ